MVLDEEGLGALLHSTYEEHVDNVVPSHSRVSKIAQGPPQNRILGRDFLSLLYVKDEAKAARAVLKMSCKNERS